MATKKNKSPGCIVGLSLVLLAALIVVAFILVENHLGEKEWESTQAFLKSKGIRIDSLEGSEIAFSDSPENFFTTPILRAGWDKDMVEYQANLNRFEKCQVPKGLGFRPANWEKGEPTDWQKLYVICEKEKWLTPLDDAAPAAAIYQALNDRFAFELTELDTALEKASFSQRPNISVSEHFGGDSQGYLDIYRNLSLFIHLRGSACLENGDNEGALKSIRVLCYFANSNFYNGIVELLLSGFIENSALSIIWEGIETRKWSREDLIFIQQILKEQPDCFEAVRSCSEWDMEFQRMLIGKFEKLPWYESQVRSISSRMANHAYWFPAGTMDFNRSNLHMEMYEQMIEPFQSRDFRAIPKPTSVQSDGYPPISRWYSHSHVMLGDFLGFPFGEIRNAIVRRALFREFARVSCGIERFRLEQKRLPATLKELAPNYIKKIPVDWYGTNQEAVKYRVDEAAGQYRVYSIGVDLKDSQGEVAWIRARRKRDEGDLVWAIPAIRPPERNK